LGARVTALAVDPADPNIVYVGVAAGPGGPGVFRSLNALSALATWTNILTPATMTYPDYFDNTGGPGGPRVPSSPVPARPPPAPTRAPAPGRARTRSTSQRWGAARGTPALTAPPGPPAGVWIPATANTPAGATWTAMVGGNNQSIPRNNLPHGTTVGRVTVA